MMADGRLIDGSWELTIYVTDLDVSRTLRVTGDLHIGGVMLKLVEDLQSDLEIKVDWSDHALWWPRRNMWLSRTRTTLDQYGVQADAQLQFTPMHKNIKIQLPDLQYVDMRMDVSVRVFAAVITLCKQLGIRHPEELSLLRPYDEKTIRKGGKPENKQYDRTHNRDLNTSATSQGSIPRTPGTPATGTPITPQGTLVKGKSQDHVDYHPLDPLAYWNYKYPGVPFTATLWRGSTTPGSVGNSPFNANGNLTPGSTTTHSISFDGSFANGLDISLAVSPPPSQAALDGNVRLRNFVEKARVNAGWLDSSVSLMEQGIRENDILLLRYRFLTFYDINPKYDAIRINQIYNQAKWALLNEELDCTEEEMLMFAALQLQVQLQSNVPEPDLNPSGTKETDDIDAALNDLQMTLEGTAVNRRPGDITSVPELADYLRFMKPKRMTFKSFKPYWFYFKDTTLIQYKSREDAVEPLMSANLKGCEVTPDVNISSGKFGIRLMVPTTDGMQEMWLRCESDNQYARWMSACKLASKGKTMADSSYEAEVSSILAFLSMQRPAPAPAISPNQAEIQPEQFIAPRFLKKFKSSKMSHRILEAHANVSELCLYDAKMNYIKAWQALPDFGIAYFTVNLRGSKKEELIGIAYNRLMRMHLSNGNALKTWRFNTMKAWNVNWEIQHVIINFEEEDVVFYCTSADCKVVHEFIGGYIFCSMRSKESSQTLNEEMFHKLTGGWS